MLIFSVYMVSVSYVCMEWYIEAGHSGRHGSRIGRPSAVGRRPDAGGGRMIFLYNESLSVFNLFEHLFAVFVVHFYPFYLFVHGDGTGVSSSLSPFAVHASDYLFKIFSIYVQVSTGVQAGACFCIGRTCRRQYSDL